MEDEQQSNPFASPAVATAAAIPDFDPNSAIREFHFGKSLFKWLLICGVSAAPSFMLSLAPTKQPGVQILAMVLGVLTYVGIYVYVESRELTRRMLADKSLRIAVKTGFTSRIAITILFPVGVFLDMVCGTISISLVSSLFGVDLLGIGIGNPPEATMPFSFAWFYTTTLLQGLLLNIVIAGYTLVVYALVLLFRKGSKS